MGYLEFTGTNDRLLVLRFLLKQLQRLACRTHGGEENCIEDFGGET